MPKVLEYFIKGVCWMFLFWDTDFNENRAHVHVGKKVGRKATTKLCKIWLEPDVEMAVQGDLTSAQIKQVIELATIYKEQLLEQWKIFKKGETVKIIKIKKK